MHRYCLLTGATGLLGRYLLRDLLLNDVPVAALVRPERRRSAEERLDAIHSHWERELKQSLPRPVCIEGEITHPDLGISSQARAWIGEHCSSILHNAASLTFWGKDRTAEPWLSNLTGTENVLEFCRRAKIRDFHYISTAFVCGKRDTPVLDEDFDCGQTFRNDYEHAKFEAEKRVRLAAADWIDRLTVYRPGVIVGDSRTGYTSTYHGAYAYFQFAWLLVQYLPKGSDGLHFLPIRFNLTGEETHNFVTVDWVSACVTYLFCHAEHHGRTYHLTPKLMTTSRMLYEVMSKYFQFRGPTFDGPGALAAGDLNDIEKAFYEYVDRYQTYWNQEPLFDRSNIERAAPHLPCPTIDFASLTRMLDVAVKDNWGKKAKPVKA
jgi:thioester reductase-like protein